MLADVGADFHFMYVDIVQTGSGSDAGLFSDSPFKVAMVEGTLNMPKADPLPHSEQPIECFLVGDDAFALKTW